MSASTTVNIALQISANPSYLPGYATFPIVIQNYDGTVPTISGINSSIASVSIGAYDPATTSFTATVTAIGIGTTAASIVIEGQTDQQFSITVTQAPFEVGTFTQSSVTVFPPAPPAVQT